MKYATAMAILSLIILSAAVWAKSGYKSAFNALYGTAGSNLDTCWLCHVEGMSYSNFNDYGADVRTEFLKSGNITTAIQAVEEIDSDGDGDINIVEISAGTFPGDALNSTPAANTTWGALKKKYE